MKEHLRANRWLLCLSVVLCAVVYPGIVLVIGQTMFAPGAQGSLVDRNGQLARHLKDPVGSRLIAQSFLDDAGNAKDEYFQPRPSAVSYNGAASGATNWGADNPALRERIIGMLGPVLKYSDGRPVGPDISAWVWRSLQEDRGVLARWAKDDPYLAERWSRAKAHVDFLAHWEMDHPDDVERWRRANPDLDKPKPVDLAALYFESYARGETTTWPETGGRNLQAAFFNVWWRAHPGVRFKPVPADMVMASGSGLDPHITWENALYQHDRVAAEWAKKTKVPKERVAQEIRALLEENKEAPLGGLTGVHLVNVLEVNLALSRRLQHLNPP